MKKLILALFIISCSSANSGDEGEYDGSMEAHELAMEMSKQVNEKIENLDDKFPLDSMVRVKV